MTRRPDALPFLGPFRSQKYFVFRAVIDCFKDRVHRNVVLLGDFLGTQRLRSDSLAIQYFGSNPPDEELFIVRARLRPQVTIVA